MPKNFLKFFILILIFIFSFNVVSAGTSSKSFGGRIIHNKAIEIQSLESAGYTCTVYGQTISITPFGSYPSSFLIPMGVFSKTGYSIRAGQLILGLYSLTPTPITCVLPATPPLIKIVNLNAITLYGTSR